MVSLRDVKRRIKSVGSTQKLTSAMRLIATAKLRHAMTAVANIREYERTLIEAIRSAGFGLDKSAIEEMSEQFPWYFTKVNPNNSHAILVIGANKGLCGNYNLMIVREALVFAERYHNKPVPDGVSGHRAELNQKMRFIPLTVKASEYFLKNENERTGDSPGLGFNNKANNSEMAAFVLDQAVNWLSGDDWGAVSVVSGRFVNALVQRAQSSALFPFFKNGSNDPAILAFAEGTEQNQAEQLDGAATAEKSNLLPLRIEAPKVEVITSLVHLLARVRLCKAFAESEACEHAARMTMMEGAKKNAENLIDTLTLQYNRTRQANITSELIEIIAGTNAMVQE
jgi:F-type H+-transporting ATPase subunit gamma